MKQLDIIILLLLLISIVSWYLSYKQEIIDNNIQSIIDNWITIYEK
jgi:hypothetical protein